MSKKLQGTLLGALASLAGVAAWIVLGWLGIIAGLAGALMGILFVAVYKKVNAEDKTRYCYVVAAIIVIIEIIVAELLLVAIIASGEGVPFSEVVADSEVQTAIIYDLVVGFLLTGLVCVYAVMGERRKKLKQEKARAAQDAKDRELIAKSEREAAQAQAANTDVFGINDQYVAPEEKPEL